MKKIAFASHVALISGKEYDGIGNVLTDELKSMGVNFISVRHSMDGELPSRIMHFSKGEEYSSGYIKVRSHPAPLRYLSEVFNTVRYFSRKEHVDIFVGVDPLNAFSGIILKKLRKVEKVIFYTADYSPRRFENNILDSIYHFIDNYCVKKSDEVWSVSTKISAIRKKSGLPQERNVFIPNVPPVTYEHLRSEHKEKFNLITTGVIDKQLDYEGIIKAVKLLKDKHPKITLTIVGNGPDEDNIKQLVETLGLEDSVKFTGRLPLSETLALVSKAGIGLALYTGAWGFNQFGDSTKCREYFTFGLPVLSTDTHSTVDEIREYKAGIVTDLSVDAYVQSIEGLFKNYDDYSQRSLALGKKYKGVHRKELTRIMNS